MTLIPVSNTSVLVDCSVNFGASRWIGEYFLNAPFRRGERIAQNIKNIAERLLANRHFDHLACIRDLRTAVQAVGRRHADRANLARLQVLHHLGGDRRRGGAALAAFRRAHFDMHRVIDRRQDDALAEIDVHDRPDDLRHFPCFKPTISSC